MPCLLLNRKCTGSTLQQFENVSVFVSAQFTYKKLANYSVISHVICQHDVIPPQAWTRNFKHYLRRMLSCLTIIQDKRQIYPYATTFSKVLHCPTHLWMSCQRQSTVNLTDSQAPALVVPIMMGKNRACQVYIWRSTELCAQIEHIPYLGSEMSTDYYRFYNDATY